jgi:hypothetical protein
MASSTEGGRRGGEQAVADDNGQGKGPFRREVELGRPT